MRFFYHRADRKSAVFLIVLILIAISMIVYVGMDNGTTESSGADSIAIRKFKKSRFHRAKPQYYNVEGRKADLFPFDPNTADSTALLRLGLQPWQVRNIYKYRAKGGMYRKPTDFARLYGLTVKQYRTLEPYIHISSDYNQASTLVKNEPQRRDSIKYPVKIKETERIVLNLADTNMLKRVPGIGSAYARAIVNYGKRLGGYVSVDQLDEIDDFPLDAKRFFVIHECQTNKLNLNKLTLSQLRRHPYINFYQAKAIVDYRRMHGQLRSLSELKLSRDFTPDAIHRLQPYIEF